MSTSLKILLILCGSRLWLGLTSTETIIDCTAQQHKWNFVNAPLNLTHTGSIVGFKHIDIADITSNKNLNLGKTYIAGKLNKTTLTFYATSDFKDYAKFETSMSIQVELQYKCANDQHSRVLIFKQPILPGNYYAPVFNQLNYKIFLPTPIFAGFDLNSLVQITASDYDLTDNQLTFEAVNLTSDFLSVSTKKTTATNGKSYYPTLCLNNFHIRLDQIITFQLLVKDAGVPPKQNVARVIIREDKNMHFPILARFEHHIYHAQLKSDMSLPPIKLNLIHGSNNAKTIFAVEGTDSEAFILDRINNGIEVRLSGLGKHLLSKPGCLHFTVTARQYNVNTLDLTKAAVVVSIPNLAADFHFEKPIYMGSLNKQGKLQLEPISFNANAYNANVKFYLNATYVYNFNIWQENNKINIKTSPNYLFENCLNKTQINLNLIAHNEYANLTAIAVIILELPTLLSTNDLLQIQPEFEKSIYHGRILNKSGILDLETIRLLPQTYDASKTELVLKGEQYSNFDYLPLKHSIKLRMLKTPTGLWVNGSILWLTLEAENGYLKGHTVIALTFIDDSSSSVSNSNSIPIFEQNWLVGKITGCSMVEQSLELSVIKLTKGIQASAYIFMLIGNAAQHFEVIANEQFGYVSVNLKQPLEPELVAQKTEIVLQIRAIDRYAFASKNALVLFLQLPYQECMIRADALLNEMPKFSSNAYIFTVQPNRTGSLGFVTVMQPNIHNKSSAVYYSINVPDEQLRKRITINSANGELSLLSLVQPGNYYFTVMAQVVRNMTKATTQATARVHLNMNAGFRCYANDQPQVADALMIKHIAEECAYDQLLYVRLDEFCSLIITSMLPNDKPYVYINEKTNMLSSIPIDRESSTFRAMSVPQLHVKLQLKCLNANISIPTVQHPSIRSYNETFEVEDIPYSRDTTILHIHIDDINDNAPMFVYPKQYANLGDPDVSVYASIFPEKLIQVRAEDADAGKNAQIMYSLYNNNNFEIDPDNGNIYAKAGRAAYVRKMTQLIVQATDLGGLTSELILNVHRLTHEYYILLMIKNRTEVDELLEQLHNHTGFEIRIVKQAIVPCNIREAELHNADDKQFMQQIWINAFNNSSPIAFEVFLSVCNNLLKENTTKHHYLQNYEAAMGYAHDKDVLGSILAICLLVLLTSACLTSLLYTYNCSRGVECASEANTASNSTETIAIEMQNGAQCNCSSSKDLQKEQ